MDKAIILNTDFTGEERRINVKDGMVKIDDKTFLVDKAKPIRVKGRFGKEYNLYILKWNKIIPMTFKVKETVIEDKNYIELEPNQAIKYELEPVDINFKSPEELKELPQLLTLIHDMHWLEGLGKYPAKSSEKKKERKLTRLHLFLIFLGISAIANFLYFYVLT